MTAPKIETPRGVITTGTSGRAVLSWSLNFQEDHQEEFSNAQKFVDSEILRRSEPFTPLLTGTLIKTGILGTEIGSGLVQWIAPYAKYQYYATRKPGSLTGRLRGPFWFERMKEIYGREIIAGAKRIAGGDE